MEAIALIIFPLVLVAGLAWAVTREDARLRRRARRYRELELEGIEHLRRDDPYPEHAPVPGGYLRDPDGRPTDADRVLHEELLRIRDHNRGKGVQCLL